MGWGGGGHTCEPQGNHHNAIGSESRGDEYLCIFVQFVQFYICVVLVLKPRAAELSMLGRGEHPHSHPCLLKILLTKTQDVHVLVTMIRQ